LILPGQTAHFVRNDSHLPESRDRVKSLLGTNQLDLLFIDGDHSYEGVKQDFLLYRELVRPGGLIMFHDVAHHAPEKKCYVDQLWNEVKVQYPSLEIIEDPRQGWAGIGILHNEPLKTDSQRSGA